MTVIDASTLAKYILKEKAWEQIEQFFEEDLYSLDLALIEVTNVIWKHHTIFRRLSLNDAHIALTILKKLHNDVLTIENSTVYLDEALNVAISEKITVYDSLYVVAASKHNKLISSDKKQVSIAQKLNIDVIFIE